MYGHAKQGINQKIEGGFVSKRTSQEKVILLIELLGTTETQRGRIFEFM